MGHTGREMALTTTPRATVVEVALEGPLLSLVRDVEEVCARSTHPAERGRGAAAAISSALRAGSSWLPEALLATSATDYCANLAHVDGEGRFSVLVMAWLPGQRTPIHNHIAWCATGVYRGLERNVGYRLRRDAGGEWLEERAVDDMGPGAVGLLVPPDEDIHAVECVSTEPTASIHIYGADILRHGSSINRCFDRALVRSRA